MTVTSRALTIIGSLLLLHAVYSAYEHSVAVASLTTNLTPNSYNSPPSIISSETTNDSSSYSSSSSSNDADTDANALHSSAITSSSSSSSSSSTALPLDIIIETLFSVALLCTAVVLSAPSLQPIRWHVWAGQIERRGVERVMEGKASLAMAYRALEERPGFLDIRAKRKEFAEWAKENDQSNDQ